MPVCSNCGEDNAERARFCQACGTSLTPAGPGDARIRKTITVVFTDVAGSTAIGERLDAESVRSVMARYFKVARAALEAHGGTVEKFIGDAVVAVFGIPRVHEDDALRAVRAAAELRDAATGLAAELESEWGVEFAIRVGVNTGEVVAGDAATGGTLATGDAMNVAARLEQAASPGSVLIGERTYRLVRHVVEVERVEPLILRGKSDRVPAYRLIDVARVVGDRRRMDAPMVGREEELALVLAAFAGTVERSECRMVSIVGSAGLGKSRLVDESLSLIGDRATVVRGRCLAYGEGITYWPIAEIVRQAASIGAGDAAGDAAARLAALMADVPHGELITHSVASIAGLLDAESSADEISWGIRRFLEIVARTTPLVVVIDDIHWAEPSLLDLIEGIVSHSSGAPILILCMSRPELLDVRPGWGQRTSAESALRLEPLGERDAELLIPSLLGGDLADQVRTRITTAAEGNPFFMEELLTMCIDEGLLRWDEGRWVAQDDLSTIAVPPTIDALLAARLDRLPGPERRILEPASVIGQAFQVSAITALLTETQAADVEARLLALTRKDVVLQDASSDEDHEAFRFRHILIRDAQYASMPKELRADLHEAFAGWLEVTAGDRIAELEEIIGHHLEQAYMYRTALRRGGSEDLQLAERAARRFASGGHRALARSDMRAVVSLYTRVIELLPRHHPDAVVVLPDLGTALFETGDVERAEGVLRSAIAEAESRGDDSLGGRAGVALLRVQAHIEPGFGFDLGIQRAQGFVHRLESVGDPSGLSRAKHLLATFHYWMGRAALAEKLLDEASELARAAGDRRQEAFCISLLTLSIGDGPTDVTTGLERLRDLITRSGGHLEVEARALCVRGQLEGMQGRFGEARESIRRSRMLFDEIGVLSGMLGMLPAIHAQVEASAGDLDGAEGELRSACEALESMGETSHLSTVAGELARLLGRRGDDEAALSYSLLSERTTSKGDVLSEVLWRCARSGVLSRRGDDEAALILARSAVAIAEATDYLVLRADAVSDLAEVHRRAGRGGEAIRALSTALGLYERKGNVASAGKTRAALAILDA